ncbi:MAG: tetratricopeptide repeat protein [bacterium]
MAKKNDKATAGNGEIGVDPGPTARTGVRGWQAVVLLAAVCAACYANSLGNAFHYDDIHSILENDSVRTLRPDRVWAANSKARFVSMYSYSLNYALHGFDTLWGWHLVNVTVHFLIGLLVYRLALDLWFGRGPALVAALVFVVHPLCTEPVNYIQARSAQFVLLFALASAASLLRFLRTRRPTALVACGLAGLLGMFSKEVGAFYVGAALFLAVLFGMDRERLRRLARRKATWVVFAWGLVLAVLFVAATGIGANIARRAEMVSYPTYLARQAAVFFSYGRLLFVPYGLAADHFLRPSAKGGIGFAALGGVAGFVLLAVAAAWLVRRRHPVALPLTWVLVMHLPYQFVPGPELMVEYRAYPMVAGFALFAAWAAFRLLRTPSGRLVAVASVLAVAGSVTINRNTVWRDGLTLWSDCLAKNEKNPRAHNNLGNAYLRRGNLERARAEFKRAMELMPGVAEVHYNMGALHIKKEQYDRAVQHLEVAVKAKPEMARAHNALGSALALAERFEPAVKSFRRALELEPYFIQARNGLGNAYAGIGKYDRAIEQYQVVLAWGLESPEVYRNLGDAYREKGEPEKAEECYRRSLGVKGDSAEAHNNLGNTYKDMGEYRKAAEQYAKALEIDPDYRIAHNNLGSICLLLKDFEQAKRHLERALEIEPGYASAHCNLGSLFHMRGDHSRAEAHYREAVRLKPGYVDAHYNLGIVLKKQGRDKAAVLSFERAARLRPGWGAAHAAAGLAWHRLGDTAKAREALARAVEVDPGIARRPDVRAVLQTLESRPR